MKDYKPNSHKFKEDQKESGGEGKKVEKVVSGKVKTKKKSGIHKLSDVFISEDANNVKSYVLLDVLVPAIKKAISDIVTDGIDMILYGGTGRSKKRSGPSSYVSYSSYSSNRRDERQDTRSRGRTRYSYDDIILETYGDAEEVLDTLKDLIDTYDEASVADLYDLVGITGDYTDNNYGWTNLNTADVMRVRNGYMLKLPKPIPLKK